MCSSQHLQSHGFEYLCAGAHIPNIFRAGCKIFRGRLFTCFHSETTRISRGNRIDLRTFEMAFLLCAEPFGINISVHDYVYISLWYLRGERSKTFCKIEVPRSSEMLFSESHLPLSFGPFQTKLVHQLGIWSTETMLIQIVLAISIL